jgi:hypothetical protein
MDDQMERPADVAARLPEPRALPGGRRRIARRHDALGRPGRRGLPFVAGLCLAVALTVAGCGGGGSTSSSQAGAGTTATGPVSAPAATAPATVSPTASPIGATDLRDGRYAARIEGVDAARRQITVDVIQLFLGTDAARAAEEDHAAEVPPPNDVWIRNSNSRLRTLFVAPGAPITVNTLAALESGGAIKNTDKTLAQLAAIEHLDYAVLWLTLSEGSVTRIAEQFLP